MFPRIARFFLDSWKNSYTVYTSPTQRKPLPGLAMIHSTSHIQRSAQPHALTSGPAQAGRSRRPGFSMVELIVVIAVVALLLSLLMPGLSRARATALKLMCAANERELGVGFMLYSEDNAATLPESHFQTQHQFADMSAITTGAVTHGGDRNQTAGFDGIGLLWKWRYIDSPNCLHCPANSHRHTCEANAEVYSGNGDAPETAYCNYHYTGHFTFESVRNESSNSKSDRMYRRMFHSRFVLSSDSLRSREDFSHGNGANLLYSDGSVGWSTPDPRVIEAMPLEGMILENGNLNGNGWITNAWDHFDIDG